jgi:hypothetical protein
MIINERRIYFIDPNLHEKSLTFFMSFQAYLDNIKAKTGKSPEDFKKLASKKGSLENGKLKPTVE